MEISLTSRLRRAEATVRTDGVQKEALTEEASSVDTQPQTDRLSIIRQTVDQLKDQSQQLTELLERSMRQQQEDALRKADGTEGDSELEALSKRLKIMRKCQEIAARIMRGDKVPPEDEQYLMENDLASFKLAMAARTPKKDPKEYKSVLDDEDKSTGDSGKSNTDAAPSGEASGETAGDSSGE